MALRQSLQAFEVLAFAPPEQHEDVLGAAEALGMSRATIYRKVKDFGIA